MIKGFLPVNDAIFVLLKNPIEIPSQLNYTSK